MKRFWPGIIKSIFTKFEVKKIVEIGAASGKHTKQLLGYCNKYDGELIVIDPKPGFNVEGYTKKYGSRFQIIKDLSLHALEQLSDYDVVLIDGDHNWYTVYHELKLIEKIGIKQDKFPFVFLHDIEWPYGRRDMYYNPKAIPEPYRKPYARKGIVRGQSKLSRIGGINADLYNATYENGEKNGVLTAIEDFLNETKLPIQFYRVYGNWGLGILAPSNVPIDEIVSKENSN